MSEDPRVIRIIRVQGRPVQGIPIAVSGATAARWVAEGIAEYVEPAPAETAMSEPPANAMRPRARPRRRG